MRRRLAVGNWKMHGSLAANRQLLDALRAALRPAVGVGYAVCVPYPYLAQVAAILQGSPIEWGAQNLSEHDSGAYTGEVSGPMLKEFTCRYVLVGHSERRSFYGETDTQVAAKFAAALRSDLTPILCVGETLEQRERGETEAVLARQLEAVLDAAGVESMERAVIAYEPVWAIGTGRTATPAQAESAHEFIRVQVAKRDRAIAAELTILYGGSVKPVNAPELFGRPHVDGGLIGGASLAAGDFVAICKVVARR